MKPTALALAALLGLSPAAPVTPPPCPPVSAARAPVIQLALLLDTSNSMDGLIDQARTQLWKVVNQLSAGRRGDRPAALQVALYEYGNNRLSARGGYVRQVVPFTTDLDRVSEALFALSTFGGEEYCGTVLQSALDGLSWSGSPDDLKVVFIAGNEPFTQGPVDPRRVVQRARASGIVVNTVHCGSRQVGEQTGWREGARLAAGSYLTIDQDRAVVHVDAPQDAEIARLGVELNRTYIPYGAAGASGQERQARQDENAMKAKGSATERAVAKSGRLYSNAGWDLVDAVKEGKADVDHLAPAELPADLQALSPAARKERLAEMTRERARLQARIQQLHAEREKHVAAARAHLTIADDTLDVVLADTLRTQAACKGIELRP